MDKLINIFAKYGHILLILDIVFHYIYEFILYGLAFDAWAMACGLGENLSMAIALIAVLLLHLFRPANVATVLSIVGTTVAFGWGWGFCGGILVFIVIPFIWHIIMIWLFSMQLGDREQKDEDNLG